MKFIIAISLIMTSSSVSAVRVDDDLTVFGTEIPRLFHSQQPGPYDQLFDTLVGEYPSYSLMRMPMRRAQRRFLAGEADCLFVGSKDPETYEQLGMPADEILLSDAVNRVAIRVYTRSGEMIVRDLEQLRGKTVAIDFGAGTSELFYKRFREKDITILPVAKLEQAFSLLKQNRVSAIVAFDFDVELYVNRHPGDAEIFSYDPTYLLEENSDAIVCWRSEGSEAFIKHVNKRLEELKAEDPERSALRE
ncbi:substrate-binding periplasmic protein [Kordiimonas laminariae]|uniref:substrate-binding periplasmic protein n=1 Tax=Kordiimonas laminariae TaxID=2917717 RepID=UPI001FF4F0A0|nr:transporter substrate-binding domain-containing protein [Kordiimonas laminariae]MCK0070561.1 transporter substrate-binding domain-containing protein [Kordiimonas laminariae]